VRWAGVVVAVQGAAAVVVAVVLLVRGLSGADQRVVNGFGTAGWFVVVGGAVLAAGLALYRGRLWGRGIAVFTQLLLLPVAWYLTSGSHRPLLGVPAGAVALAVLVLLFSPPAVKWATGHNPARSRRADPDSR
jgi:hypothetical protein